MEIERKFTIKNLPDNLDSYDRHIISQAYLCADPVVRIRRSDDEYYMTYKGKGLMVREEYNLPLSKEAFDHLLPKADGNVISKTRYLIPLESPNFTDGYILSNDESLTIELDVFDEPIAPLIMAEIEFPNEEAATHYIPESWFDSDVTNNPKYHNSNMIFIDKKEVL